MDGVEMERWLTEREKKKKRKRKKKEGTTEEGAYSPKEERRRPPSNTLASTSPNQTPGQRLFNQKKLLKTTS